LHGLEHRPLLFDLLLVGIKSLTVEAFSFRNNVDGDGLVDLARGNNKKMTGCKSPEPSRCK